MVDLKLRSNEQEMLDKPGITRDALFQNLKELDIINRLLGGHRATLSGLRKLMRDKQRVYKIIDFGCGGGDALAAVGDWAAKSGFNVEMTGVDILPDAIEYARSQQCAQHNITFVAQDFQRFAYRPGDYDIAICSLFCHHLYGAELQGLIRIMTDIAGIGVVINDLHRHWFAYYSIRVLTVALSRSELVKNDAPLSVSKGFTKTELQALMDECGIKRYSIHWLWAFRYLALIRT